MTAVQPTISPPQACRRFPFGARGRGVAAVAGKTEAVGANPQILNAVALAAAAAGAALAQKRVVPARRAHLERGGAFTRECGQQGADALRFGLAALKPAAQRQHLPLVHEKRLRRAADRFPAGGLLFVLDETHVQ